MLGSIHDLTRAEADRTVTGCNCSRVSKTSTHSLRIRFGSGRHLMTLKWRCTGCDGCNVRRLRRARCSASFGFAQKVARTLPKLCKRRKARHHLTTDKICCTDFVGFRKNSKTNTLLA